MSEPIVDRVCKVCGRTFIPAPYHRFKRGKDYYCVWSCYAKDEPPPKVKGRKPPKPVDQYTLDGKFVASYPTISAAARATGYSIGSISSCCRGQMKAVGNDSFRYTVTELS